MRTARGFVTVVVCATAGALLLAPAALAAPTWTATGSMNTLRVGHTQTLLPTSGKVLVAGGVALGGGLPNPRLASAELYDPTTGTWTTIPPMHTVRENHTATLLGNGKVLVAGGMGATDILASAELYDPETGTWTTAPSMHTARDGHTATLLGNGKVLVAGGNGATGANLASAELYDPDTGVWSATESMNTGRSEHTATLANGKVLVAGGNGAGLDALASAELYDPAFGWRETGSMNTPRLFHTATLLQSEQVLVAGGYGSFAGPVLASAERYDPASGTWSATGSMNTARAFHTTTLLLNQPRGKVLVAGGFGGLQGVFALASAEIYQPGSATFTAGPSLNTGRNSHTATFLPESGQVLVAGGVGGVLTSSFALASAELFSAPTAFELAPSLVAASMGIGPGKALANKATAIQTAVNAGQTARACRHINGYLALVKAQTGKKLSTAQATQLTTAATDLADELGC
jgi:hypothetical protein